MWATLAVNTRLPYIIPALTLEPTRDIRIRNKIGPAHSWGGGGGGHSHTFSLSYHLLALCIPPVFRIYDIWCGSGFGSADPCLWLMDTDHAIFLIELQDANKKQIKKKRFFCLLLFEGTFTSFNKDKKSKRSHKKTVGIKVFLTIFAWW